MAAPCVTSTMNLSNLPAMAGSSSPTLEAVVVAVLLLLGQGTHSGKDHVQQQAGLQEHSGSGSRQAQAFQGAKTTPQDRRGEHCLVFLLLQQLIASFCSLSGSPQLSRTWEMLEMGRAEGCALPRAAPGSHCGNTRRTLLPLHFWYYLASRLPRRGKSPLRCLWKKQAPG